MKLPKVWINFIMKFFTMQKFMLIVREDLSHIGRKTPEQRFGESPDMGGWVRSLMESGNYISGQPLAVTGRYVTQNAVLSEGPFISDKEGISGYDIILAEDIDQAVSIAQSCPMVKTGFAIREVRPFQDFIVKESV
jgi:hypothetical protein